MKPAVLPVYYYHDHFRELLSFVRQTYDSLLTAEHYAFIAQFEELSKDSQCLFIRMVNRRGRIFRHKAFRYAEIADPERAVTELGQRGHVRPLHEEDYAAFLGCLSKDALIKGSKNAGFSDIRSSWPKARLIDYLLTNVSFQTAHDYCGGIEFIALGNTEAIEFLLYLYFGKMQDDLKNFALRDLGILRTNKEVNFSARFTDGAEARACFHYSRLLDRLDIISDDIYRKSITLILDGPVCSTDYASELRSRAAHKVGLYFEKRKETDRAARLYRAGSSFECNERLVRLLYASGDKDGAQELLRRMIDDPESDDEFVFASDFYARKFNGRRTGLCTQLLRASQAITVDDTWRGNPEAGVAGVMRRQGHKVFYAENTLWHCLFGLLFWEELFERGQLHSGFDWVPHCLKDRSFARIFATEIETKLAAVTSRSAAPLLLRTVATKWGRPNGIFAWNCIDMDAIRALLTGAEPAGIAAILRLMCEDYRAMRDGFPDLMLVDDGAISFLEVKAEGDVIRRNQLMRLRQLGNSGIHAHIGRVNFRFDPEQDYVVVDTETTGGWANGDRITEIGAVKIRNHKVVEEWHSLINPRRVIPAKITHLTGITNDMVRSAPLFAEIADSFMQFMSDGIFVAHNVNFDYGFIGYEYDRLERRFRFPKLCTCAGMRRRFPGHKSYSLGNLCEIYDIELKDHHRALADARAAARLLNLINEKRDCGYEDEWPLKDYTC
jgi:DNA polymerase III subunit epsilon